MLQEAAWGTWGQLVGRDLELARMLTLLNDAASRQAVVARITGAAGGGKTRLVTEVVRQATAEGFTVLSGHCAELGESVPYLPLADALRNATQSPGTASRLLDALATRPVLNRLLPEGETQATAEAESRGMARQQMFGAVLGLIGELAAATPVLLVFEDLHWADASTRDLLTFLCRVLRTERVALVGTYRTDDLHRRHPLRPRRPAPPPAPPAAGRRAAAAAQRDLDPARPAAPGRAGRAPHRPGRPA